jgi:hypothetical protein
MARPSEGNGGLEVLRFLLGATVMIVTVLVFWKCLPRDGKMHRFVGTEWEPYIGVAFCCAFALSFTMMLSGLTDSFG